MSRMVAIARKPGLMRKKLTLGSRAFWLRQMRQWHSISAAICLIGMLLFAFTGVTLNHAGKIEAKPAVSERMATMPAPLAESLKALPAQGKRVVPEALAAWASGALGVDIRGRESELSPSEIYIALPRPGGDAWLSLDRKTGEARYERTDRGWISWLNDLHKGRDTGLLWSIVIDATAILMVFVSITGIVLIVYIRRKRWSGLLTAMAGTIVFAVIVVLVLP